MIFWIILLLATVLYRNHMVPDRQGSAAHEIPNHWISPSLIDDKKDRIANKSWLVFDQNSFMIVHDFMNPQTWRSLNYI